MLLFKLILGVSTLLLFIKIAKNKCENKNYISQFYYSLYMLCEDFYGEMLYKKTPLETFLKKQKGNGLFIKVIDAFINNKLDKTIFNKEFTSSEIDAILTFFSCLGDSNTESQKNIILSYKEQFFKKHNEKLNLYNKCKTVYVKIGFSLGLMAMVVVL